MAPLARRGRQTRPPLPLDHGRFTSAVQPACDSLCSPTLLARSPRKTADVPFCHRRLANSMFPWRLCLLVHFARLYLLVSLLVDHGPALAVSASASASLCQLRTPYSPMLPFPIFLFPWSRVLGPLGVVTPAMIHPSIPQSILLLRFGGLVFLCLSSAPSSYPACLAGLGLAGVPIRILARH